MAKIINRTRETELASGYRLCRNIFGQARGLMFSKKKTLVFDFAKEKRVPLHMLFVFFTIHVLFLDSDKKVVDMKKDFKPFTCYSPKKHARYVVEIPKSSRADAALQSTQTGDQLYFQE